MDIAAKIIGYVLCFVFLSGLVVLVVMMCLNEFHRFCDRRSKKKEKKSKVVET